LSAGEADRRPASAAPPHAATVSTFEADDDRRCIGVALVVCYMRQKLQRTTSFVSRRASGGDGEDSSMEPQSRGELGEIECKISA
jgi:hypothetical protein